MKKLKLGFVFLLVALSGAFAAIDTISVDVGVSLENTMPIGLIPFEQNGQFEALSAKPEEILKNDFHLSGRFAVVESEKFKMVTFVRAGAKFYVTGKIEQIDGSKVRLSCYLYATQTKDLILGEAYSVSQKQVREALHDFTDKMVKQLWGEYGVASTSLAWVSKIDGVKQIVVADYDGYNRRQITRDTTISMMPTWTKDNGGIVFVSFRNGKAQLFERRLNSSAERRLFADKSQTFSPAVNPKTGELLFASISGNKTTLYLGDPETGKSRKLLYGRFSQVSPSWSPFGTEILYTSDRGGRPQIFAMGKDGSDVRRVTFMGNYNERASWSPSGDRIVYTSMDGGKMNIYTCALDGSDIVQLTSNAGNNEHPTWSPDGMLIAFSSDRSGSYQIYVMRKDGTNVTRITNGGENTSPTWSWYSPEKQKQISQQNEEGW
ncbi:PD40 domain-containing protein [Fibrobacter sp. UWS1]|uniref:PD40 domain-containing protein n=1 Tax=Fibrobacter sp. UWS1 TaxID=1896220 RepID=UPI000BB14CE4|nr:PD40 domain-containing protein [Fibrobacter sp. UWS1]PBC68277.1 TolB protein [Fibrobacter sp. UWS1]